MRETELRYLSREGQEGECGVKLLEEKEKFEKKIV